MWIATLGYVSRQGDKEVVNATKRDGTSRSVFRS
jgi:hypothetical protein